MNDIEKVEWLCDALDLQVHERKLYLTILNDRPLTIIFDILVELTKRYSASCTWHEKEVQGWKDDE